MRANNGVSSKLAEDVGLKWDKGEKTIMEVLI